MYDASWIVFCFEKPDSLNANKKFEIIDIIYDIWGSHSSDDVGVGFIGNNAVVATYGV